MTVMEFQAERIERMGEALAHYVATTRTDRLDWKPEIEHAAGVRTVLEQAAECVVVNRAMAALLRGKTPEIVPGPGATFPTFESGEQAQTELVASAHDLAEAIRALDDSALDREFPHWRGPVKGAALIEAPYRNMAYHSGQVNLLQLLYGDTEFHMPPKWTK